MSFPPTLSISAGRRISGGLIAVSGALIFSAFGLIGSGISASNLAFASDVSSSLGWLLQAAIGGFLCYLATEVADHPDTPETGHPHSKSNYMQTVSALLVVYGLGTLAWGTVVLFDAATIPYP